MAALSKGDFNRAEELGNETIRRNPKDPYAILTLGVVYENTARPELARQYFEVLASMNPQATAMVGVGPTAERRTIADIAAQHLTLLGGKGKAMRSEPTAPSSADLGMSDDANVIIRFQTLQRLLDEGLITRDEYNERRGANLGALLPYSAPSPATGVGRPAPGSEQLVMRLRYLALAYEEKSITAREQVAERGVILDALLPTRSAKRADPPPPVTDQLQVAASVGRLEKLRAANVITVTELNREKAVVFQKLQASVAATEAAARVAAGMAMAPPATPTGPGLRLSSYGSESQAMRAWAALQKAHPSQLGGLQPLVTRVSLRRRGVIYRLNAGPVTDRSAAAALCRSLRRSRVACEPTVLGAR